MSGSWIDTVTSWLSSWSWGDVPTWLSALVSGAALFAAVVAARAARDTWRLEQQRDRAREAVELAAQASLVAAFPGSGLDRVEIPLVRTKDGDWEDHSYSYKCPAVVVRNASQLPVYDVVVEAPLPHDPEGLRAGSLRRHGLIPPSTDQAIALDFADVAESLTTAALAAWAIQFFPDDGDEEETAKSISEWLTVGRPSISFTDANGQRWLRDAHGKLHPTAPHSVHVEPPLSTQE